MRFNVPCTQAEPKLPLACFKTARKLGNRATRNQKCSWVAFVAQMTMHNVPA